jgi:hypothetical protein
MIVRPGWRGWALVASVAFVLVACHKKDDDVVPPVVATATPTATPVGTATPTPTATPVAVATLAPTTAEAGATIGTTAGSITVSGGPGQLAGMLDYPASTSSGTDAAQLEMTTTIPTVPNPQPAGTALAAFELQLQSAWTFDNEPVVSPVALPNGYTTTGLQFYEYVYDSTAGISYGALGPATVSGDLLTFSAPSPATAFPVNALDTYAFVLSGVAPSSGTSPNAPVKY